MSDNVSTSQDTLSLTYLDGLLPSHDEFLQKGILPVKMLLLFLFIFYIPPFIDQRAQQIKELLFVAKELPKQVCQNTLFLLKHILSAES